MISKIILLLILLATNVPAQSGWFWWWDDDDTSSTPPVEEWDIYDEGWTALYLDSRVETNILDSAGQVKTWYDSSGNNHHLTYGIAANRPSNSTGTDFESGQQDRLFSDDVAGNFNLDVSVGWDMWAAFNLESTTTGLRTLLGKYVDATNSWQINIDGTSSGKSISLDFRDNNNAYISTPTTFGNANLSTAGTVPAYVVRVWGDADSVHCRILTATTDSTFHATTLADVDIINEAPLGMGVRGTTGFFDGRIFFAAIKVDGIISDVDKMVLYVKDLFGWE